MYGDSPDDHQEIYGATMAEFMSQANSIMESGKKVIIEKTRSINFYLIRHAQAEINLVDIIGGRSNDSPLTTKGVKQAKDLSKRIQKLMTPSSLVVSSPALRTLKTLEYSLPNISKRLILDDLQELDQGDFTGKYRKKVYTGRIQKEIAKDYWNFKPPSGESQADVANRAYNVVDELVTQFPINDFFIFSVDDFY